MIHTIPSYAIIYTKTNKKVYDVSNRYIPTKREKTAQNTNSVRELTKVSSKIPQERDIIYKKTSNHPFFNSKTIVVNSNVSVGKQNNVY